MKKWILMAIFALSMFGTAQAKTVMVTTQPLTMAVGLTNFALDIGIGGLTIGAGSQSFSADLGSATWAYSNTAIRVGYFFSGEAFTSSWYLRSESYSSTFSVDSTIDDIDYEGEATGTGTGVFAGYNWDWGGFNLGLGVGAASMSVGTVEVENDVNDDTETVGTPATVSGTGLEFYLGFSF